MRVRDDGAHAGEAAFHEAPQKRRPERAAFRGYCVNAEDPPVTAARDAVATTARDRGEGRSPPEHRGRIGLRGNDGPAAKIRREAAAGRLALPDHCHPAGDPVTNATPRPRASGVARDAQTAS